MKQLTERYAKVNVALSIENKLILRSTGLTLTSVSMVLALMVSV